MSTFLRYNRWEPGNVEAAICWTCVADKAILRKRVNGCAGMAQALAAIKAEHAELQSAPTKKPA